MAEQINGDVPSTIGVESDVLTLLPQPPIARVRFRISNEGATEPFPDGDWLNVRISARLYDPAVAQQGRFEEPLAAGPEVDGTARATTWSSVDLPLPVVFRGEYSITAKVFSADPRYRKPFRPSLCRVVRATIGSVVRVRKDVLEGVYGGSGYANPAAEEELRRWVREGFVVIEEGGRLLRAKENAGRLSFEPLSA